MDVINKRENVDGGVGRKRRKKNGDDEDNLPERLEEDDLDLLEENLEVKVQRSQAGGDGRDRDDDRRGRRAGNRGGRGGGVFGRGRCGRGVDGWRGGRDRDGGGSGGWNNPPSPTPFVAPLAIPDDGNSLSTVTPPGSPQSHHHDNGDRYWRTRARKMPATVKIDSLPPEMLQAIYERLPFTDLLSCRLVNSGWKTAATDVVRKRCRPIPLRIHLLRHLKGQKILEQLNALVQGAGGQFPVDKFLTSNSDDNQQDELESKDVASLFELLWSVQEFVTEFLLYLELGGGGVPVIQKASSSLSSVEEFPKLKLLELCVMPNEPEGAEKTDFENEDKLTQDLIKSIIEKSRNLKNISLVLLNNAELMNTIPRCVQGLGIGDNLKLLTSLEFKTTFADTDHWQLVSGMGLKLKELKVWIKKSGGYQKICLKAFLESQAETLTSLVIGYDFSHSDIMFSQ